jgi:hypothetical protein
MIGSLYKKRKQGHRHTEALPCEDTRERQLTTCQGERLKRNHHEVMSTSDFQSPEL